MYTKNIIFMSSHLFWIFLSRLDFISCLVNSEKIEYKFICRVTNQIKIIFSYMNKLLNFTYIWRPFFTHSCRCRLLNLFVLHFTCVSFTWVLFPIHERKKSLWMKQVEWIEEKKTTTGRWTKFVFTLSHDWVFKCCF